MLSVVSPLKRGGRTGAGGGGGGGNEAPDVAPRCMPYDPRPLKRWANGSTAATVVAPVPDALAAASPRAGAVAPTQGEALAGTDSLGALLSIPVGSKRERRRRHTEAMDEADSSSGEDVEDIGNELAPQVPYKKLHAEPSVPKIPRQATNVQVEDVVPKLIASFLPRKVRRRMARKRWQAKVDNARELVCTLADVESIVAAALKEHTERLRSQYDEVMQQRLAEHWQSFTAFQRDSMDRMEESRPRPTYMS